MDEVERLALTAGTAMPGVHELLAHFAAAGEGAEVAFIGLGNMGLPMAGHLIDAGHTVVAFDTVDAEGLFLHPAPAALTERGGRRWLRINAPAELTLRRGPEATSAAVRNTSSRDTAISPVPVRVSPVQ